MSFDDSGIFHGTYDPVKAHEYYLKTRHLKGRPAMPVQRPSSRSGGVSAKVVAVHPGGKPNRADTKSRQAELQAQKEALQARLERLRQVLEEKVAAAKKRSGIKPVKKKDKKKAPETPADKADRNKAEKDRKPLTAKQKADKAKKAKEEYEKEHPTSLSQDIDILQAQIKDIQAKIQKAVEDARQRRIKAGQHAGQ